MLAKDMCSQNQKVGHLICLIHNNVFWTQRIFRVLRNSLFQNKRPLLKKQNGARSLQRKNLLRFLQEDHLKKGLSSVEFNLFSERFHA